MSTRSQDKWILFCKDNNFKKFHNRVNIYLLILIFLLPPLLIIDALLNKFWRQILRYISLWVLVFMGPLTFSGIISIGPYDVFTIIVWFALGCYGLHYNLKRPANRYKMFEKNGWVKVASSNEYFLKTAESEWELQGLISAQK